MLDTIIRNGLVVDGSGGPGRPADVGIRAGRVVAIGALDEAAAEAIDADGRIVSPGFIDVHTHLDAQAFWDPTLSPSPLHGVTTVVAGNCGFSIAPLSPETGAYLMPMLARVEGMPLASLQEGVPWDWSTTADYLDRLDESLTIHTAFMVGHSAIRRLVMGEDANLRAASADELASMCQLLRDGLAAGALGFSTTTSDTHNDAQGRPVPSRFADEHELVELASVCGEFEGTSLEVLPRGATNNGPFEPEVAELMIRMSSAAQRPLNWNVIQPSARSLDTWLAKLEVGDQAQARGAKVVGLTMPVDMKARFSFHAGFVLDVFEGWAPILALPIDERLKVISDPEQRRWMEASAAATPNMKHLAAWDRHVIVETFAPETDQYRGSAGGRHRRRAGHDAVRSPHGDRDRRRAANDVQSFDSGSHARGLGSAAADLARSAQPDRGVGCRRPPRHDRRVPLLDRPTPGGGPRAGALAGRRGHPHAHRRSGPALRLPRPRNPP